MDRLTRWNRQTEQAELIDWDTEEWKVFMWELGIPVSMSLEEAVNKLAEYEDLEEQELLVRLPLKPGDTFWELNKNGIEACVYPRKAHSLMHCLYVKDRLGQVCFLTQVEAEAALERMNTK